MTNDPSAPEPAFFQDICGFVLAGGRSARFGADKALAALDGRPLLVHALDALAGVGLTGSVVAPRPDAYRGLAQGFVASEEPDRGPTEGLRAALAACPRRWALVLAADMPGVTPALLRALAGAAAVLPQPGPRAVCAVLGRRHPLPGLYATSLLADWDRILPGAALQAVLDLAGAVLLGPADVPGLDLAAALRNVNRPEDLAG